MSKGTVRKSKVFALPGVRPASEPPPAAPPKAKPRASLAERVQLAASSDPALISLQVYEHEAADLVGALIDAQRAAEQAERQWTEAGNVQQSAIFGAKARACAGLASRIAKTITRAK